MEYERLIERFKECNTQYDLTNDNIFLMEHACIISLMEEDGAGIRPYEIIADFAKNNGINKVYDIGCAYGHQSEVFLNNNLDYVGIETTMSGQFWNNDKFSYIKKEYPFEIKAGSDEIAISVLCLTWNCYLYEGEKTLDEQLEALYRDFHHCILYAPKEMVSYISKYFKNVTEIGRSLYYFSK